jgi:predicted dehydrogenase
MVARGEVDAIYVATPNSSHCDFAIRAARHRVHALVEKPLAINVAQSEAMIAAAQDAGVYLMTAYRLHSDPATVKVVELLASGTIGDPRQFSATLSFMLPENNHRLKAEHWGGPLQDVGVYCVNAARHVFGQNPHRVSATSSFGHAGSRYSEVEEGLTATLEFDGGRLAQFYCGFGTDAMDYCQVLGTQGSIALLNAFRFGMARRLVIQRADVQEVIDFEETDNFSGMIAYFADCILTRTPPRPDGNEGLADMRTLLAIEAASAAGTRQDVPATPGFASYHAGMVRTFPPAKHKLLI